MKNTKKLISALLSVCMLLGALSGLFVFGASAAETTVADETQKEDITKIDYLTKVYRTAQEKLDTMTMRFAKGNYQLWINEFTGEMALKNIKTEEVLFSNPYDVGLSSAADSVKAELLSQITVEYTGNKLTGSNKFTSYTDAALNNQIKVKSIKNGMRVEYTIGREETKYLVPRLITKERFETQILEPVIAAIEASDMTTTTKNFTINKFKAYWEFKDPEDPKIADNDMAKADLFDQVPITAKLGAVYIIDANISPADLMRLEEQIKTYCPAYTYEELDMDHTETEYESEDQNPPVFKMALEYKLDDLGMTVTLPANGIRFDESLYQLSSITVLPFMGAGQYSTARPNKGYTFIPDGSGAIFRFEDIPSTGATVGGNIYGQDYAYYTVTGKYQETFKIPVFGIVRENEYVFEKDATGKDEIVKLDNPTSSGFFAIVEEGDSLAKLVTTHHGTRSEYHTVQFSVNPRPFDEYRLSDSVSVANNSPVKVVSERKYLDNYKVRYIMLTDDKVAAEKGITDYYSANYTGMALAYRDYLTGPYSTGTQNESADKQTSVLTRLSSDSFESQIPLYLETFGTVETVEKILSIPVNVMTPLTTFGNIKQIYKDLSQEGVGISNINVKLTGYANGGMYSTVPYGLKWENAVGGKKGFSDLLKFAKEINSVSPTDGKNLGIFPDFDFVYINETGWFDGVSLHDHAVKTIDDRYIGKSTYSATYQALVSDENLAISPAYFSRFYNELASNYLKFSTSKDKGSDLNISVATLGTDLNSDFDEDEPYNREDSKSFTVKAFKNLSETYGNVMTTGGNAYTWQYVDHILDMPIDSSRYLAASNAVPFSGIVLHGYKQYSGSPINMEGNIDYGILKAIENGASLYFILTYDNATVLKEDPKLSQYYSVRYDIWAGDYNEDGVFEAGDLVDIYHKLNNVTSDLQDKLITNHVMLTGKRVPEADELEADLIAEEKARLEKEAKDAADKAAKARKERLEARTTALDKANASYISAEAVIAKIESAVADIEKLMGELVEAEQKLADKKAEIEAKTNVDEQQAADDAALLVSLENVVKAKTTAVNVAYVNTVVSSYNTIKAAYDNIHDMERIIKEAVEYFTANDEYSYSAEFIEDCKKKVAPIEELCAKIDALDARSKAAYNQIITIGAGVLEPIVEEEDEVVEETSSVNSKYLVDDGTIVAVTYGEIGDDYRTFILNYNYFTIEVEYEGQTYEIEKYGFVKLDHDKN